MQNNEIKTNPEELEKKRIHDSILEGLKDLEENNVHDGKATLKEIKEKYGL